MQVTDNTQIWNTNFDYDRVNTNYVITFTDEFNINSTDR